MKRKILYSFLALLVVNVMFIGCKKDLTLKPNDLLLEEDVFTDKNLITSTLARFYQQAHDGTNVNGNGGTGWGQSTNSWQSFQQDPDDAVNNNGGPSTGDLTLSRDRYKIVDYAFMRRLNQFIQGIRSDASKKAMTPAENANFEAQALFLRAYVFYLTVRTLGGVTIVGDQIFTYDPGQDVTPYQLPRDSEEDCYNYILAQCDLAAQRFTDAGTLSNNTLGVVKTTNSATANKWAALMLKARVALAAGSIAKYTPLRAPGNVKKDKRGVDVVGIPSSKANDFYTIAFNTAQQIINTSPYVLQVNPANPELAFYQATTIKSGNTEVIWAFDRKAPSINTQFTADVAPVSAGHTDGQTTGNQLGPTLNLVEAFENRDGSNPRILDRVGYNAAGDYVIYDDAQAPFKAKDARLYGTIIWPEAPFRGTPVPLRAGELTKLTQPYTYATNAPVRTDNTKPTGPNGPFDASTANLNKTGFNVRKFVDETPNSGIGPNFSEIWWPKMRIAEAYMIVAEAGLELGGGSASIGLSRINTLRTERGRILPLTLANFTFDKIVNENRVEFAFEDHRVWDLKRWRLAHVLWNGVLGDTYPTTGVQPTSQAMTLYAYRINVPGNPGNNNGKWVFQRKVSYRRITTPFNFREDSYYATIDQTWINPRNPNWVGNPYQTF